MTEQTKNLAVFSGGRDSSAAAALMAHQGYQVVLFTYQGGLPELVGPQGDSAPDIRHAELVRAFPDHIDPHRIITGNTYLVRKLAIERTNSTHVVYPIALALVVHVGAILYCLENNIKHVTCGYSGYQRKEDRYIEQQKEYAELMANFLAEYDLTFHTPIIDETKEGIIDILERHGVSSNTLENKSVFGAIPFEVEKALQFWNESLPICRDHIAYMAHIKNRQ